MFPIRYIITSGGTREPIDTVRFIGNTATGRLGAGIADEACSRGHAVSYIHGVGSAVPACRDRIEMEEYGTTSDLEGILEACVSHAVLPAVVVHAAAVADYIPETRPGKIASDRDELVIRLKRAGKIVDRIKSWNPGIHLVKFKLESNRTRDELLQAGIEAGRLSGADWVVANDTRALGRDDHFALIIRRNGSFLEARGKLEIARRLLDETEQAVCAEGGSLES